MFEMITRKTKLWIVLLLLVALMLVFAFTLYEWNGIFAIEGILAGIAMAIAVMLDRTRTKR